MTNRIVRFKEFGGPEVLKIFDEPITFPKKDEVRIRVKALGLNQAEVMLREGRYVGKPNLPSRIGIEASGIIEEIGEGVSDYVIGDEVSDLFEMESKTEEDVRNKIARRTTGAKCCCILPVNNTLCKSPSNSTHYLKMLTLSILNLS